MVHGAWCMAHGAWRMVHGAWRIAHGADAYLMDFRKFVI